MHDAISASGIEGYGSASLCTVTKLNVTCMHHLHVKIESSIYMALQNFISKLNLLCGTYSLHGDICMSMQLLNILITGNF